MAGCFGESLIRKFGEEPPDEWIGSIARLNDYQLAQGMRRIVFSGKSIAPSLPEFVKLCRTVGHADDIPDESPAPFKHPALVHEEQQFDSWDEAANIHLFAVVLKAVRDRRFFDERQTRILVRFKKLWADQMRLSANEQGVPIEEQKEVWAECMRRAEEEIARAA